MGFLSNLFASFTNKDIKDDKQIVQDTNSDNTYNSQSIQDLLSRLLPDEYCDEYLAEAIYEVVLAQFAEVSFLQRSFAIDPIRADRMLYSMEVLGIVGKEDDTHTRKVLIDNMKALDSHILKLKHYLTNNLTFKDLFDKDIPNNLKANKDGFIIYPNGVRLLLTDGNIGVFSVICDVFSKLGYNTGELFPTCYDVKNNIVNFEDASIIAFREVFTNKLVCIISKNNHNLEYIDLFNIKRLFKRCCKEYLFVRLAYGIKNHNISRSFIERIFNVSQNNCPSVNKDSIIHALLSEHIEISRIKEIIEKKNTSYIVEAYNMDGSELAYMINDKKNKIKSYLNVLDLHIVQSDNMVSLVIPNYIITADNYKFTFGGSNFQWLSDCLYNGYSMQALTSLLEKDPTYKEYADNNKDNAEIKEEINRQAECYSMIDSDILKSKVSINKFSINSQYVFYQLTNYIAMAAFYKQCDVLLEDFIESTHGEYEIVSKSTIANNTITKVKAYREVFCFTNGHSMLESTKNIKSLNEESIAVDNSGYIYVLINPSFEGMVKIGKTTRDPNERAKELSATTGVPTPFILVYYKQFKDCNIAETEIHQILESNGYRVNENREFFKISSTEAIKLIQEYYDENEI